MTNCNRQVQALRRLCMAAAASLLLQLGACGGGGGGGADTGSAGNGGGGTGGGNTGGSASSQRLAFWAFENLAFRALVVDGGTGARTVLPASEFTGVGSDSWSVRPDGAEAVRLDARENIAILSTANGARLAGFSLSAIAGSFEPEAFTEPRLSPDGRHLLAYWRADSSDPAPALVVWDRQGNVLVQDSPFNYNRSLSSAAVGWTPDGRALYLAGSAIVAVNPGTGVHTRLGSISLPSGASTDNADGLHVSPDGTRLAVALPTRWTSDSGLRSDFSRMVYVMNLDGSNLRQLTLPSARIRNTGGSFDMLNPVWSPDGTQLAATPTSAADGCPRVKLLQADAAAPVEVDPITDGDSGYLQLPPAAGGAAQATDNVCGVLAWWRP